MVKAYQVRTALLIGYAEVREIDVLKFTSKRVFFKNGTYSSIEKGDSESAVAYFKDRDTAYAEAIKMAERSLSVAENKIKRLRENIADLRSAHEGGGDHHSIIAQKGFR